MANGMTGNRLFGWQIAADRSSEATRSAGKCGQIYDGPDSNRGLPAAPPNDTNNHLISSRYLLISLFRNCPLQSDPASN
jgi:hypothetical protein